MDPASLASAAIAKAVDPAASESIKTANSLAMKLLGPVADELGQQWAEKLRERNVQKVLEKTEKRAQKTGETGYTKPRLAASAFEAAQYADSEVVTEYLSGVLSSSRSEDGGDDSGLPWSALIARLSSLQLRVHYLLYRNARRLLATPNQDGSFKRIYEVNSASLMVPQDEVWGLLGIDADGGPTSNDLLEAMDGLQRESLLQGFSFGDKAFLQADANKHKVENNYAFVQWRKLDTPFDPIFNFTVSSHGIRLYLWGLGSGKQDADDWPDPNKEIEPVDAIESLGFFSDGGFAKDYWGESDVDPNEQDDAAPVESATNAGLGDDA